MSPAALLDLDKALAEISAFHDWDFSSLASDPFEVEIDGRDVVKITSDFATMGGSRPRQIC